ncbi:MAG: hypothetical protein M9890_02520 [Thermomicrobiales bacterium]|nr:hypothetical protein [Thermomicrobiales bacterium]
MSGETGVIYCGTCGAMNPRTNHFCSACGHQLVDAYHASEGLRVYATADSSAPLVEIVPSGADLQVLETDEELPGDFVKIALDDGRVGYVRLHEVEQTVGDIEQEATRREPIGCISSTAVLAILALVIVSAALVMVTAIRSNDDTAGFIAFLACIIIVPFLLMVVGFYLYVRKREDELLAEREENDVNEQEDTGQDGS